MLDSIFSDIKRQAQSGNMITRIILLNVAVFVLLNLVYVFDYQASAGDPSSFYTKFKSLFVLPSDPMTYLKRFWTMITYMFTHKGFFHIFWNMLLLYWFGRIFGDFIGDSKVLPLYLLAGVVGGMVFILTDLFLPTGTHGHAIALGASASVMGVMMATATLSPDYTMSLIFLGPVKIKWIALVFLFLDIVGTAGSGNEGGHWAHLGGALFGYIYIIQLRRGVDLTLWLQKVLNRESILPSTSRVKPRKAKVRRNKSTSLSVVHKKADSNPQSAAFSDQDRLDQILDKIKAQGYDNLTQGEKDYLNSVSNS